MKNFFKNVCVAVSVAALLWFTFSIIDVNLHNQYFTESYGNYASWNLFTYISKI